LGISDYGIQQHPQADRALVAAGTDPLPLDREWTRVTDSFDDVRH
jgi:hypothetical protein